jgi:hypothetical protein
MRSLVDGLCAHAGRGACSDAERRAALWLHDELRSRGHEAWVETRWLRPQWALALALGSLLAAAGSLRSVVAPVPGLVAAVAGAVTMVVRPFPRRATQHVLTALPDDGVVAVIAAAYDAPRRGLVSERLVRHPAVPACAAVIVAAAVARVAGYEPGWLGVVQLVPTLALIVAVAAATDRALGDWERGANDNASGVAVAVALFEELSRRPLRALTPALLLVGAGHALPREARRHLRREGLSAERVTLLELGPCGAGEPVWAARHPQVRAAAERASAALGRAASSEGRVGARWPAIRIEGSARGEDVDPAALDAALDLALGVVDAVDAVLSGAGRVARPRA